MILSSKLSGITLFSLSFLVFSGFLSLASCKKDKSKTDEVPAKVIGSVLINGSYTTFSRYSYYITGVTELQNYLVLFRTDNSEITLRFPGTEEKIHELGNGDSTISIQYKDAGSRLFNADSGRIEISSYKITQGIFQISGGFEFHAKRLEQSGGISNYVHVRGYEGGFVDILSQ